MKTTFIALLATLAAVSASAQSTFNIERVYKHYTTANGGDNARQGVFANGKFYIHNWTDAKVEVWDQDGNMLETFESKGTGPAITADEAGNIVIENADAAWPSVSGQTRYYRIFPAGQNNPIDLSIKYDALRPTGFDAGTSTNGIRSDYFGPIEGDIMSDKGGILVSMMQSRPVVNIAKIANGAHKENHSFWVDTAYVGGNIVCNMAFTEAALYNAWKTYVGTGAAYSQVTCYKYGDEYLVSKANVGLKGFTFSTDTKGTHSIETQAYKGVLVKDHTTVYSQSDCCTGDIIDTPMMTGDRLFNIGGRTYVIKNTCTKGRLNMNCFAVADDETGKVIAFWNGFDEKDYEMCPKACASWFNVVAVDDHTAEIYQYFPANTDAVTEFNRAGKAFIAKYVIHID